MVLLVCYPNYLSEAYCSAHSLANEIEVTIGARKPSQKLGPTDDMSKEVELMMDKNFRLPQKNGVGCCKHQRK